jgi:RNA polymerase sigma-70 factor (ECF subfamily)
MAANFTDLVDRVKRGDNAALAELVQQYEPEVRLVARLRLGPALRPYLDSVDLVQSVHRSVLIGLRDAKYALQSPDQLIALALTIVRRKVARQWQRLRRQQRDSGIRDGEGHLPDLLQNLATPQPDPGEQAAQRDLLEKVCAGLDASERQLIELKLLGFRTVEIARQLGLNPDVLRVKLSRLRRRFTDLGLATDWF